MPCRPLTALASALLLVAVAFLGCGGDGRPANPTPGREGLSWTHRELLDCLNAKGMDLASVPLDAGAEPSVLLSQKGADVTAVVVLKRDAASASETAGAAGGDSFSWGRFAVVVPRRDLPSLAPAIKKALGG